MILLPRRRCVDEVHLSEMVRGADGSIDVRKANIDCSLGPFELQKTDIVFRLRDREVRLRPKPALQGAHDAAALFEHSPEYARAAGLYRPDPALVGTIRAASKDVHVLVFFGSWCSFCSRFLPHTLLSGVVYVDGKEVGRIVGNEWIQPEKALARFVR